MDQFYAVLLEIPLRMTCKFHTFRLNYITDAFICLTCEVPAPVHLQLLTDGHILNFWVVVCYCLLGCLNCIVIQKVARSSFFTHLKIVMSTLLSPSPCRCIFSLKKFR